LLATHGVRKRGGGREGNKRVVQKGSRTGRGIAGRGARERRGKRGDVSFQWDSMPPRPIFRKEGEKGEKGVSSQKSPKPKGRPRIQECESVLVW